MPIQGTLPALPHPYILFNVFMSTTNISDLHLPVKRLQLGVQSGTLVAAPKKELFLRGPIPLEWLAAAARLPGKTVNVALALWWRHGMAKGKPFKLTRMALSAMNVERDAASAGLARLEQQGLIQVERKTGQRPTISILSLPAATSRTVKSQPAGQFTCPDY